MALDDLVEDTSLDQFSDGKEEPSIESIESIPTNADYYRDGQFYTVRADYDKEEKPCPSCRCISKKAEEFTYSYECPNLDCGTVYFHAGWNEQRPDFYFLGTVEIKGWRYDG